MTMISLGKNVQAPPPPARVLSSDLGELVLGVGVGGGPQAAARQQLAPRQREAGVHLCQTLDPGSCCVVKQKPH